MLDLKLLRGHTGVSPAANPAVPLCRFVNVQLCGAGAKPLQGTVLLENPRGTSLVTLDQLKRQVKPCYYKYNRIGPE